MINNTPLYIDLLDYLERDGIASLSNNFDPNAFMTNYDELDTTSPLINNSTVAPTIPYIIPPLGGGDGGDGPRQGITSLDPIDKIIDYTNFNHPTMNEIANDDDEYLFDAENFDEFYNPLSMGIKGSTIHEIGLAAAEKERARLQEVARVKAFEEQQRQAKKELEAKAAQIEANRMQAANEQNKTGGYQSDFAQDRDFMDGGDRDRGNNPGDKGGSNTMGSF
jgi:hypothetical protein